jgi:hypothetical protein
MQPKVTARLSSQYERQQEAENQNQRDNDKPYQQTTHLTWGHAAGQPRHLKGDCYESH